MAAHSHGYFSQNQEASYLDFTPLLSRVTQTIKIEINNECRPQLLVRGGGRAGSGACTKSRLISHSDHSRVNNN
ncbi:hypothetical protein E2C01_080434 [Portunus trituberculatus]|uniref:Uncharacterized protein n=1 Tax=Portunus trituberculatus TaxID=210409 RepID=A0A5B7IP96_PORTR|nr:hypothetical protein [Portunus trituberculatus]